MDEVIDPLWLAAEMLSGPLYGDPRLRAVATTGELAQPLERHRIGGDLSEQRASEVGHDYSASLGNENTDS